MQRKVISFYRTPETNIMCVNIMYVNYTWIKKKKERNQQGRLPKEEIKERGRGVVKTCSFFYFLTSFVLFQTIIATAISYGADLEKNYNAGIVKSIPRG